MLVIGFVVIFGFEKCCVLGGILFVVIVILVFGLIFDLGVKYCGIFVLLLLSVLGYVLLIGVMDIKGVLLMVVLLSVFVLVMIVVFDVIGMICVVVG